MSEGEPRLEKVTIFEADRNLLRIMERVYQDVTTRVIVEINHIPLAVILSPQDFEQLNQTTRGVVVEELRPPLPPVLRKDIEIPLTARQREVLVLMAGGKNSKEIASHLSTSRKTAEYHLGNIYRKLDVHSSMAAVTKAVQSDWFEIP